jgi:hypothetical protein
MYRLPDIHRSLRRSRLITLVIATLFVAPVGVDLHALDLDGHEDIPTCQLCKAFERTELAGASASGDLTGPSLHVARAATRTDRATLPEPALRPPSRAPPG